MAQYDINLRDYWRVIKKRKFIITFTVLAMGFFSFIFAIMGKPVPLYMASSSVKIEKSSSVTGLYIQAISWSQTDDMETQAAVIQSYLIMEKVAKRLGMIPTDLPSEKVRVRSEYLGIILNLKSSVETEQEGYSNIINIIVTSQNPGLAQRLANTIANVYREERTLSLNKRTLDAKRFIENQLMIIKERLRNSEEAVRNFRENNKLVSLSAQTSGMLGQMARLQVAYEEAVENYRKIKEAGHLLEKAEDKPLTSKTSFYIKEAPTLYKSLNDKIVQLMLKRDSLLLAYTEDFPQVVEINRQILEIVTNMKAQLSSQEKILAENIKTLKKKVDEIDEQIKTLPEKGLDLARLEREVRVNMEVYTLLETKYQESLIKEAEKIEEVEIVKPALMPTVPINPPKTMATGAVGIIIGMILGIVFAFLIETFDTSIGAIEEVEDFLGVHVLGIIPHVSVQEIKETIKEKYSGDIDEEIADRNARLVSHFAPKSILAESYRALRTNLSFTSLENDIKTAVFTSSSPQEGKTTAVVNLAITMAQSGNKVLLVDGDLRKPVISRMFGLDQAPGLTDVILGNYEWKKAVKTITDVMMGKMSMDDIMETPGIDNLNIITSGTIPPNPAELVNSKSIKGFIKEARSEYDMVLIDSPPVLAATDAAILGSIIDGVVLVYQVGKISRGALKRAKAQLDNVKAKVIGVVLNGLKEEISPDFADYDYYKYYYAQEEEEKEKTFWGRLFSIPGFLAGIFGKKSEKNKEDKKFSVSKVGILLIAVLILTVGILYQTGYIMFSRTHNASVENTVAKVKIMPMPPHAKMEQEALKDEEKPTNAKTYTIQVIARRDLESAKLFVKDLKEKGMDAHWARVDIEGRGVWYRVFIGHFADSKDAARYMKEKGIDRSYPGSWVLEKPLPASGDYTHINFTDKAH